MPSVNINPDYYLQIIETALRKRMRSRTNLERLNECPQEDSYRVTLPQQLDKASSTEQSQKTKVDEAILQFSHQSHHH